MNAPGMSCVAVSRALPSSAPFTSTPKISRINKRRHYRARDKHRRTRQREREGGEAGREEGTRSTNKQNNPANQQSSQPIKQRNTYRPQNRYTNRSPGGPRSKKNRVRVSEICKLTCMPTIFSNEWFVYLFLITTFTFQLNSEEV